MCLLSSYSESGHAGPGEPFFGWGAQGMGICGFGADPRKPAGRVILGFGVLFGALLFGATTASADCTAGFLGQPTTAGDPLVVSTACRVKPGSYKYGAINVIAGGQLIFDEGDGPGPIDLWASSIIIEKNGAVIAQNSKAPKTTSAPNGRFGFNGSVLTIHLWGANASKWNEVGQTFDAQNQGALCKTPVGSTNGPCGLPLVNGDSIPLPGGYSDNFYQYGPLLRQRRLLRRIEVSAQQRKLQRGRAGRLFRE